eukprot:scaffold1594_cov401-Prasinococcus_capsulatus_cf.AAC.7
MAFRSFLRALLVLCLAASTSTARLPWGSDKHGTSVQSSHQDARTTTDPSSSASVQGQGRDDRDVVHSEMMKVSARNKALRAIISLNTSPELNDEMLEEAVCVN